jgi:acyl-CoA synthetase (AMP-forming)/AMP-acid ligase II
VPSRIATGLVDWAIATPDRWAVADTRGPLTFDDLETRVGVLAACLLEQADLAVLDGRATLPIIVGYDTESLIAIQAAIRASLSFAPLDSTLPPAVVADIVMRMGDPATAIASRPEYATSLPAGLRPVVVPRGAASAAGPQPVVAGDRAMVVFTSGSTGRPKGVLFDWSALDALHDRTVSVMAAGDPLARTSSLSPFSFTAGILRAITPSAGPFAYIRDPAAVDPIDLLEEVEAQELTVVALTPGGPASRARRGWSIDQSRHWPCCARAQTRHASATQSP